MSETSVPKIAFIFDDRLSHDRKVVFSRVITILKAKFNFEILPTTLTEKDLLDHLKTREYSMVLLPWHKYLSWKKVESHFGSLRMQGPAVAGYFADSVLPFEIAQIPPFNRLLLLDFYRLDQFEIEMILGALSQADKKSGFAGIFPKNTPIYFADWFDHDGTNTRCIDAAMGSTLLASSQWSSRSESIRHAFTSLWSLCFMDHRSFQTHTPRAFLEMGEHQKRLAVKLVFESTELTLKNVMEYLWPNADHRNPSFTELTKHCDFLRVQFFPEQHLLEMTLFFLPEAPVLRYPGEIRGFWVEPLKIKFLKSAEEEQFTKRIAVARTTGAKVNDQLQEVLERLRALHAQIKPPGAEERVVLDQHLSNILFLVGEIEKKVVDKKKAA